VRLPHCTELASAEDAVGVARSPAGDAHPAGHQDIDTQAIIDEVLKAFRLRLASFNSASLEEVGASPELSEQVGYIFADVLSMLAPPDTLRVQPNSRPVSIGCLFLPDSGTIRANRGTYLIESLKAASELFDVALPVIVRRCGLEDLKILDVSQRLHRVIMDGLALASRPHVELLLTELDASREDERRRISRELHDRVGHGMALALQHLDLYRHFRRAANPRAEREFETGFTSLDDAFRTVRSLSTELRGSVGKDGVTAVIESYLRDHVPSASGITASLEITGDANSLSPPIGEELYLVMREACRNALRHGFPSEIRLTMTVSESEVTVAISDNGCGFSFGAPDTPGGGGLASMTERVERLNGNLTIESAIGAGTTVTARVPLAGGEAL
jgi:signal transduction histidine kinase